MTLVEVLICIGLLTTGFIAFAYVASLGIRLVAEAKYRTVATVAASQKLEQLRAAPSLADEAGAVEYLDADGNVVCVGGTPCGDERYLRSWSIATVPMFPRSVIVEVSSRHAHRGVGTVVLRTVRSRNAP